MFLAVPVADQADTKALILSCPAGNLGHSQSPSHQEADRPSLCRGGHQAWVRPARLATGRSRGPTYLHGNRSFRILHEYLGLNSWLQRRVVRAEAAAVLREMPSGLRDRIKRWYRNAARSTLPGSARRRSGACCRPCRSGRTGTGPGHPELSEQAPGLLGFSPTTRSAGRPTAVGGDPLFVPVRSANLLPPIVEVAARVGRGDDDRAAGQRDRPRIGPPTVITVPSVRVLQIP